MSRVGRRPTVRPAAAGVVRAAGLDERAVVHRALRWVEGLNLITHSEESVAGPGAKRKIYGLTASGERVLAGYLEGPMAYVSTRLFQDRTAAVRRVPQS